jgi:hypothetical protein
MHAYIPWVFVMTRRLDLAVGYLVTWYITLHSWASVRMWTVDSGDVQLYTAFLFSSLQFPSCPSMTPPWQERNGIGAVDKTLLVQHDRPHLLTETTHRYPQIQAHKMAESTTPAHLDPSALGTKE